MNLELCNDPPGTGPIHFYEQKHYWLSNFSAFGVLFKGHYFPTSEHAYQASKYPECSFDFESVKGAKSAHEAMTYTRIHTMNIRSSWSTIKRAVMKDICREKLRQHPYILRRLPQTETRELIEASPVDGFWGMGRDGTGRNELGKIWMELRDEISASK